MTEMSCKVMNKDEFTRVLQNLLGVSTEYPAYSALTSQDVTLLTKKEFTGFLTTFLQFPTESAKTLDGDVSRGAEQIFQELDETHSGVVDLAKLPERTVMDRLRAEIALKHGSLPQAWGAINLFDSSQLRELMLLTPQSISSVVFDGVRKFPKQ